MIRIIIIWFRAQFLGYPYWRVHYDNEPRFTSLLEKHDALALADIFGGEAWIDYDCCGYNSEN